LPGARPARALALTRDLILRIVGDTGSRAAGLAREALARLDAVAEQPVRALRATLIVGNIGVDTHANVATVYGTVDAIVTVDVELAGPARHR